MSVPSIDSPEVENLLETLALEPAGEDLFRGRGSPFGGDRIFGGHLMAQALRAAQATVAGKTCHTLHCVFVRAGASDTAVDFAVERLNEGSAFAARTVTATQGARPILRVSASFHALEDGLEHDAPAPEAAPPEDWLDEAEHIASLGDAVPAALRARLTRPRPVEIRLGDPLALGRAGAPAARQWMRARTPLGPDPALHQQFLAYASDMGLMEVAMRPHGADWRTPQVQSASLNHTIWFHRPVDFNAWRLYALDSPVAAGARALNRGQVFDAQGRLAASVVQETLIRAGRG